MWLDNKYVKKIMGLKEEVQKEDKIKLIMI